MEQSDDTQSITACVRVYLNIKLYETHAALISVRYHKHSNTHRHPSLTDGESLAENQTHSSGLIDSNMLKCWENCAAGKSCSEESERLVELHEEFCGGIYSLLQKYETSCKHSLPERLYKLTKSTLFSALHFWIHNNFLPSITTDRLLCKKRHKLHLR